jgi:hypothetical protein
MCSFRGTAWTASQPTAMLTRDIAEHHTRVRHGQPEIDRDTLSDVSVPLAHHSAASKKTTAWNSENVRQCAHGSGIGLSSDPGVAMF